MRLTLDDLVASVGRGRSKSRRGDQQVRRLVQDSRSGTQASAEKRGYDTTGFLPPGSTTFVNDTGAPIEVRPPDHRWKGIA